jgi:hypothetical protein
MAFKSVFDKSFKYRNSSSTDIRLTFERVRREQCLQKQRGDAAAETYGTKVVAAIGRRRPIDVQ